MQGINAETFNDIHVFVYFRFAVPKGMKCYGPVFKMTSRMIQILLSLATNRFVNNLIFLKCIYFIHNGPTGYT